MVAAEAQKPGSAAAALHKSRSRAASWRCMGLHVKGLLTIRVRPRLGIPLTEHAYSQAENREAATLWRCGAAESGGTLPRAEAAMLRSCKFRRFAASRGEVHAATFAASGGLAASGGKRGQIECASAMPCPTSPSLRHRYSLPPHHPVWPV